MPLTDSPFFQGSLDYLRQVRAVVSLPVLRKEFIVSTYQLYETVLAGADVSMAMGQGAQLAHASADMVVLSERLETLADGVLKLRIPTREEAKPRRIEVK